jgi:cholesterol transport system auxiliary component
MMQQMKIKFISLKPVRALAVGALVALTACAQDPVPQDQFHRLNLPTTSNAAGPKFNGVVEVERLIADGLIDSRPILFTASAKSAEVQSYHYHFWTEPPSIMLQKAVTAKLRQANAAKSIVTPNLRIEPDFILSGKILRFEQIVGSANKVVISLELSLKNAKLEQLIHLDTYTVELPSQNASVGSAVAAFSLGVDKILSAFLNDLNGKV